MDSELIGTLEVVGTRQSPPDSELLQAIGLNHDLESSVADLVDNSVDAGAKLIQIRFVLSQGLLKEFLVVDDGRGMDSEQIDAAMQLGRRNSDGRQRLGHFGVGLQAASFGQADLLTVLSLRRGSVAVGRQMARRQVANNFEVLEVSAEAVERRLSNRWLSLARAGGTVVLWNDIRSFPKALDPTVTENFIETHVSRLRRHLGLTYHRLLARREFKIEIDVIDLDADDSGFPFEVRPVDPFDYPRSGDHRYPKDLVAVHGGIRTVLRCHIWPAGSDSHNFKLDDGLTDQHQGFYLYRNGRVLHHGGWGGVTQVKKRRRLARVEIDIEDTSGSFGMSMEKTTVQFSADLVHAIETAKALDGTTFAGYLADAEAAFMEGNKRTRKRDPMLPAGQGIAPRVKRVLEREAGVIEGEEPVRIRWTSFETDDFCDVDRSERTLWLNEEYRSAILRGNRGGVNDAPVIKALLFLLFEDIFRGASFGPKDRDNVNLWTEVLNAAAREELDGFE